MVWYLAIGTCMMLCFQFVEAETDDDDGQWHCDRGVGCNFLSLPEL